MILFSAEMLSLNQPVTPLLVLSSSELNGQPLEDSILDMDMESTSFDLLSQIPRNFSFLRLDRRFQPK